MKKRKIVFVYDAIYPFVKGGGERRFYEMGKRLAKMGYEVHWYGMKFWDGPGIREHDGIILHGICKARPLYTKNGRRSIAQALIFGLASFKLLFADYDIIDCCGFPYFSLFPAKLSAVIKRKPLFATWHEVWGKKYWREYLGIAGLVGFYIEWAAARLPNSIIVNGEHTRRQLKEALNVKCHITIVASGIDLGVFRKIKPASQNSDIMYAGRLMDFKNIQLIIKAIAALNKTKQRITCTIVGDGPHKTKLQDLAIKLGVNDQISWTGFLTKSDDVYAHMKATKVFVLPSKREGFGIVVLEANACGIPVLTADFSGNAAKDLIKVGVNGFVFTPHPKQLAYMVKRSLKDIRKLSASSHKAASNYEWNLLTKKVTEVYCI